MDDVQKKIKEGTAVTSALSGVATIEAPAGPKLARASLSVARCVPVASLLDQPCS